MKLMPKLQNAYSKLFYIPEKYKTDIQSTDATRVDNAKTQLEVENNSREARLDRRQRKINKATEEALANQTYIGQAQDKSPELIERERQQIDKEIDYNKQQKLKEQGNQAANILFGLPGYTLLSATPAAPFIDTYFAANGAAGLYNQSQQGTLGLNKETVLNTSFLLPFTFRALNSYKPRGLKIVTPNKIQRIFYPSLSRALDEANAVRLFRLLNPERYYSYAEKNEIMQQASLLNDVLFRADGRYSISTPLNDRVNGSMSALAELYDYKGNLIYKDIPNKVLWYSTEPRYVQFTGEGTVHAQPASDFSFIKPLNPVRGRSAAEHWNGYDPDSRIVNASGLNMNSGTHLTYVPKGRGWVRVNEETYPLLDLGEHSIKQGNYKTLFPGISRGYANGGKDTWYVAKPYKLAALGTGMTGAALGIIDWTMGDGQLTKSLLHIEPSKTINYQDEN